MMENDKTLFVYMRKKQKEIDMKLALIKNAGELVVHTEISPNEMGTEKTVAHHACSNFRSGMRDAKWTRRDLAGMPSSLNIYAYANNSIDIDFLGLSLIPRHTPITSITVKRKSIKWVSIILEDVLKSSKTRPGEGDTYGHWWIEFGDESYGWWPKYAVSSLGETVFGVEGQLNGMDDDANPTRDADHGDLADYEFHPMLYVGNVSSTYMQYGAGREKKCTCVNEEEIKDCLRRFARSYTGTWSYPFGQNCHSFQTEMMDMCCLRAPRF